MLVERFFYFEILHTVPVHVHVEELLCSCAHSRNLHFKSAAVSNKIIKY